MVNPKYTLGGVILATVACSTTTQVTFQPKEQDVKVSLTLVDLSSPEQDPQPVGELPQTIALDQLSGKIVRLSAVDHSTQTWVFPNLLGNENTATVGLVPIPRTPADPKGANTSPVGKDSRQRNMVTRMLLRAYQALSTKQYPLATELAQKATELDPELAGPHIVQGLAALQLQNRDAAKAAFAKATGLDPEDTQLQNLVKSLP